MIKTRKRSRGNAESDLPEFAPLRRRLGWRVLRMFSPFCERFVDRYLEVAALLPSVRGVAWALGRRTRRPWGPLDLPPIPKELLSVPGIRRDPEAEAAANAAAPLYDFNELHPDFADYNMRKLWPAALTRAPQAQRVQKIIRARLDGAAQQQPSPLETPIHPAELTRELKEYALSIGMSAIGIARYNPKYTYQSYLGKEIGDRVIVCVLEKPKPPLDKAPSFGYVQLAMKNGLTDLDKQSIELADFIQAKGFRAVSQGHKMRGMSLYYGVEAGLGQLGLNGQLLTPQAGSRCSITMVETDAPLVFDQPVDYGIGGICDRCKACIRRCPARAIAAKRKMHRGVEKAKINTARCAPTHAQVSTCSICTKVCPVQEYGLRAVLEEYNKSGEILGKNTDELEGYDWPLDGRHYGPDERPILRKDFFRPAGTDFDFTRVVPDAKNPDRTPEQKLFG